MKHDGASWKSLDASPSNVVVLVAEIREFSVS